MSKPTIVRHTWDSGVFIADVSVPRAAAWNKEKVPVVVGATAYRSRKSETRNKSKLTEMGKQQRGNRSISIAFERTKAASRFACRRSPWSDMIYE
jgi:hypothetical protein